MKRILLALGLASATSMAYGQDITTGSEFIGAGSVGSNEPLFRYDDQEPWKHGYIQVMPYYGGFHSFRPYNYHHVFSQSSTAAGWGMSPVLPYSQQFWHRYANMTDLSRGQHTPVTPYERPVQEWDHYPKPYSPSHNSSMVPPAPQDAQDYIAPAQNQLSPAAFGPGPALPAASLPNPAPAY